MHVWCTSHLIRQALVCQYSYRCEMMGESRDGGCETNNPELRYGGEILPRRRGMENITEPCMDECTDSDDTPIL